MRPNTTLSVTDCSGISTGELLAFNNDAGNSTRQSVIFFEAPAAKEYCVRIEQLESSEFGAFTGYVFGVFDDSVDPIILISQPNPGDVIGVRGIVDQI